MFRADVCMVQTARLALRSGKGFAAVGAEAVDHLVDRTPDDDAAVRQGAASVRAPRGA